MRKRIPRFAFNTAAMWLAFAVTAVVGFFLSPYLVSKLGPTRYGVWSLVAGLVAYLGLLDLGIRQAVNRFTARHRAEGEDGEASLIASAALRLFTLLGLLVILLAVGLAYLAPRYFNIPPELVNDAQRLILLGGATVAVALVTGVFGGAVTGIERFDVHGGIEILVTFARTAGIVYVVHAGHGLVAMAAVQLAAAVLNCLLFWLAIVRLYPELRIHVGGTLGPQIRTILSFSAALTVLFALSRIINVSDNLVIGAFLPIEAVTYYTIAGSLVLYSKEMTRSLSYVIMPRISALSSTGQGQVGSVILLVAKLSTLAATPIMATFVLRGETFIGLWMGAPYGPVSGEVLRILAFVVWLDGSRSVITASLTGMGRPGVMIPGIAVEAAANLALSIMLVQSLGIAGVALGTLIPALFATLGYLPYRLRQATQLPLRRYWAGALARPTLACVPFALATLLVEVFVPSRNLALFFLEVLLLLPLVPLGAWFIALDAGEKDLVRAQWRRLRGAS